MSNQTQLCRTCGEPRAESEGGICLACRLRPGLATAGEVFARFQAGQGSLSLRDFERLCQTYPELVDELRRLFEAARSIRAGVSSPSHSKFTPYATTPSSPVPDAAGVSPIGWAGAEIPGGRYKVQGVVARGGMGIIYAVQDRELNRQIAMKVIGTNLSGAEPISLDALPPAWVDRFVEEAQITAQLDHPNIVPVHEIGVDAQGRIYFTMKLVQGRGLQEIFTLARQKREGWNLARAVGILVRVCEAVGHAHEHGIVHRDLKPQNIMVGRLGEVYVMDWGLAKPANRADLHDLRPAREEESLQSEIETGRQRKEEMGTSSDSPLMTMDGTVLGMPAYMSPEHAEGNIERIGPASDVYSLGGILYELLAGHPPYLSPKRRLSAKAMLEAVRAGAPEPLARIAGDQPVGLLSICDKAMQRKPEARYQDAAELSVDLQAWLDGRVVRAYRTGALAELKAWILRNRLAAFSQAAGISLIVAILLVVTLVQHRANRRLLLQRYAALVSEASTTLQAGENAAASTLLARTGPEYRGWEWRYLERWLRSWQMTNLCQEPAGLQAAVVNPTQGWFVTAGRQQPLRLRSLTDGRELASFGPTDVTLLESDLDGKFVAAAELTGRVTVWQMPSNTLRREFLLWTHITALAFAGHAPILAVGDEDGDISVLSRDSDHPVTQFKGSSPVRALAFVQDHILFIGDESGAVRRWDIRGTGPPMELGRQFGRVIALTPDRTGAQVVTSCPRNSQATGLRAWNVQGAWSRELPVPAGFSDLWTLTFDSSEQHLLGCAYFGQLLLADLNTGRLDGVISLSQREAARAVFLGSDSEILSWAQGGTVARLTRREPDHAQLAGPPGQLRSLLFANSGDRLRVASLGGEVHEWDLGNRKLARRLPLADGDVAALGQARDGKWVIAGTSEARLHLIDVSTGTVSWSSKSADSHVEIWWLDISPDERQVVVGCSDGALRVFDLNTRSWIGQPILAHQRAVEGLHFSPDGKTLGTCGNDGAVALWKTSDWQLLWRKEHVAATCRTIAFSPDGRRVAHGTSDGTTQIRSIDDGRLLLPPLAGHYGRVETIAYSPDGTRIFTGAEDGAVKVWDAETGTLLITLPVTTRTPIWSVAVSPDGNRVAAADGEGNITVWFGEAP